MKLVESFLSINGEGLKAGELAFFLRFCGCNLSCSYCDTAWANQDDCPYKECSVSELTELTCKSGAKNITLTGGEPLLQTEMKELVDALGEHGFSVEIETNGSMPIKEYQELQYPPVLTMDYKLPSSLMEPHMCFDNFQYLTKKDTVKFVIGSMKDCNRAKELIEAYHLTETTNVYFSPVFGEIEPSDMVEYMKKHQMNGVRLQLQLHKFIWDPMRKGV